MRRIIFTSLSLISIILADCTSSTPPTSETLTTPQPTTIPSESESKATEATMSLTLTSDAFANGQSIPAKYSCVGKNISPAITWDEPPAGTKSFALIVDDPDAPMGTWVHWVLFNLPANARSLQENADSSAMSAGKNSSGNLRYDGPCPPSGTHRYYFKLYALDTTIGLQPGATKEQVLKEMKGHILAQGELMGTFSK
jgi:Raf kinase inhibitor-like protein, YbhB/YbcL family